MSQVATTNVLRSPLDREMSRRAKRERMAWLCLGCRIALASLFILAAVLKLSNPQGFAEAIQGFQIVPGHLVKLLAYALPWTELLAGVLLLIGMWSRACALLITLLLLGFIVGIASVLWRGLSTTCACFGSLEFPCGHEVGYCQIIRNTVFVGLALPVIIYGPGRFAVGRYDQ